MQRDFSSCERLSDIATLITLFISALGIFVSIGIAGFQKVDAEYTTYIFSLLPFIAIYVIGAIIMLSALCSFRSTQLFRTQYLIDIVEESLKSRGGIYMSNFYETNLESKMNFLQEEHKKILAIIYKDAQEKGVVNDNQFNSDISQAMKFTDIKKKVENSIPQDILYICLQDLENMGFIIKSMINPYKEWEYGIFYLGLEYYKYAIENK